MRKLFYACDSGYFAGTMASMKSFFLHHSPLEWDVTVFDVGMTKSQCDVLRNAATVRPCVPSLESQVDGAVYPSARARIQMLADLQSDSAVLYLDSDTIVLGNLDKIVDIFRGSRLPIAIGLENVPEFYQFRAHDAWVGREIPHELVHSEYWHEFPMANTGMLMAQGAYARSLGVRGLELYDKYKRRLNFAEQSIIVSLMYEMKLPYMRIPAHTHCFVSENHIVHQAKKIPYVESEPMFQGRKILVRHFCCTGSKPLFNEVIRYYVSDGLSIDIRNG